MRENYSLWAIFIYFTPADFSTPPQSLALSPQNNTTYSNYPFDKPFFTICDTTKIN